MKIFKAWIIFLAGGLFLPTLCMAEVVDRIVAVVNDEIITLSEFNNTFESYKKRIEESYKGPDMMKIMSDARQTILNKLVEQSLVSQEARRTGIVIKDDEVMDTIKDIIGRRNVGMDELVKTLAQEGVSFAEYKKEIKEQLVRMRLLRREVKSKIILSDEEIGDYYLKHREDYEGKEAVRLLQILVPFPKNMDVATKAKLKTDMDTIHKRLKNGEPFEGLAAGMPAGGDIGFVERGVILPAVEKVAFGLKNYEISDVIESPIGFHIIKVIDRRGAGIKPIESVRAEIMARLEEKKMEKKYGEWIESLKNRAHIEIKL